MVRLTRILLYAFSLKGFFCLYGEEKTKEIFQPLKTVDFLTSMGWYKKDNRPYIYKFFLKGTATTLQDLKRLSQLKKLYNRTIHIKDNPQAKAVIPKKIHQIWVGPRVPPPVLKKSQESIQRLHPDWEYKLWTDADIPNLKLYNQKIYDRAKNYGAKADILRYELLHRYGGIYLDVDFVCIKPLDDLLKFDLWTTIHSLDCVGHINNAAIGSIPGHPILGLCIRSLEHNWNTYKKIGSVIQMVGPLHFQRSFMPFVENKNMNIIALPTSFFYPISFNKRMIALNALKQKATSKIRPFIKPETYAIHYWAGSWWG